MERVDLLPSIVRSFFCFQASSSSCAFVSVCTCRAGHLQQAPKSGRLLRAKWPLISTPGAGSNLRKNPPAVWTQNEWKFTWKPNFRLKILMNFDQMKLMFIDSRPHWNGHIHQLSDKSDDRRHWQISFFVNGAQRIELARSNIYFWLTAGGEAIDGWQISQLNFLNLPTPKKIHWLVLPARDRVHLQVRSTGHLATCFWWTLWGWPLVCVAYFA